MVSLEAPAGWVVGVMWPQRLILGHELRSSRGHSVWVAGRTLALLLGATLLALCTSVGISPGRASAAGGTRGVNPDAPQNLTLNGVTPGLVDVPGAKGGLHGVSCYDESSCLAVGTKHTGEYGEGFVVPISHGVPGAVRSVPGTTGLTSVSCPSALVCWAVGTTTYRIPPKPRATARAIVRFDNGVPEEIFKVYGPGLMASPDFAYLYGISCSNTTFCMAVGDTTLEDGVVVPVRYGKPVSLTSVSPEPIMGVECELDNWCIVDTQQTGDPYYGEALSFEGKNLKPGLSWSDASIGALGRGSMPGAVDFALHHCR